MYDELPHRPDHPVDPWAGHPAWPKVQKTITMLHLGSLVYVLLTLGAYAAVFGGFPFSLTHLMPGPMPYLVLGYLTVGCLVSLVADFIIVRGLRQRRPWAWISALVLLGLDASSIILLPMTIIGLIQLGDSTVRTAFDDAPT